MEKVILVNQFDEVLGEMEKMEAHKKEFCTVLFQYLFLIQRVS